MAIVYEYSSPMKSEILVAIIESLNEVKSIEFAESVYKLPWVVGVCCD